MNQNNPDRDIPTSRFDEKDADRLIAAYGTKPSPEQRREIEDALRNQKEQFLANERSREDREKDERTRDR